MTEALLDAVRRQALLTDTVIVSHSCGKDSVVTLDLCARHFKTVHAFFMYQVPDLSFQEAALRWAERRYGIEIYRTPHFELSDFYRNGIYCRPDARIRKVGIQDVYAHVREAFGAWWIAAGERTTDSIVRNAMIKRSGSVDAKRGRFYPIAYWSVQHVRRYIATHKLKTGSESRVLGHSFRGLATQELFTPSRLRRRAVSWLSRSVSRVATIIQCLGSSPKSIAMFPASAGLRCSLFFVFDM